MNNTPKVFISSTIYDFKDLRSALKFYLEQHGYIVFTSESSDFKVDGNVHSYHACLNLIDECDYFILLVGTRVGGWFDKTNKISITRQEYRHAYKLHQQGKLEIISFVRRDVWQLKETRNELAKYLNKLELFDKDLIENVINAPTKFSNDAVYISDFVEEIGRNTDTKNALSGKGELPSGNWIRQFESFREIVDSLYSLIYLGDLEAKLYIEILLNELKIFQDSLRKDLKNNRFLIHTSAENLLEKIRLPCSIDETITLPSSEWQFFSLSCLMNCMTSKISIDVNVINEVLTSKAFFKYDLKKKSYSKTPIYLALSKLKKCILLFEANNRDVSGWMMKIKEINNRGKRIGRYEILTSDLLNLFFIGGSFSNINLISNAIIEALQGNEYKAPVLFDHSDLMKNCKELDKDEIKSINE
ncbi:MULTISPECIES: DUF4062 domain-containing protein [unclassified Moraxella]|uniref:DUF4062 domain-containing protein n=1 Tax=unclassified Moraxella TaxID=2685852 RepID=UPI003AF4885E